MVNKSFGSLQLFSDSGNGMFGSLVYNPQQQRNEPLCLQQNDGSLQMFARFKKDESGATAIEYGLIAALIAVAVIGGVTALGENSQAAFVEVAAQIGSTT
jgi:pilus assembly protein Flp/PilA